MSPQDLEADISLNKMQLRQIYKVSPLITQEIEAKTEEKKNLQIWVKEIKGQLTRVDHQLKSNQVSTAPLAFSAN